MRDTPHRDHSAAPRQARVAPAEIARLEQLLQSQSADVLREAAAHPGMNEDLTLSLLARRDLPFGVVEILVKNASVMKHRKVVSAIVGHPRTPRHVSLPMVRMLYAFELMQVALTPAVAPDIKRAAEDQIVQRLETTSMGERLTLAKQGSNRVAEALLCDPETRIVEAALLNPRMTEASIVKALGRDSVPVHFVERVCRHSKWSLRREIQLALLKSHHTPLGRVLAFVRSFSSHTIQEILKHSRLPATVKMYLFEELSEREKRQNSSSETSG
ncbi:MAG: hypothetical protein LAN37_04910 [Acidobacteriia bacterium]|nr:hypothetical protein [Terriglobia bacterium]